MPLPVDNLRSRPVFKIAALDDQEKFKPLPEPAGPYPYHLAIEKVIPDLPAEKIVFHMAGDTGGLVMPVYKHRVANEMIKQCDEAIFMENRPRFFFHLGDVVYNYGQEEEYYSQFFEPYRDYPYPIFAIAGNHDADLDPFDPGKRKSLEAFLKVFCAEKSAPIAFAGDSGRKSNIQPNVYWVLKTPLANIIALYSNVPRFGTITPEQKEWFVKELIAAATEEKALIVCLHHSAYSGDTNHGSSLRMQLFLQAAFDEAGVIPDIIFSGHVHNYQRYSKLYPDGKIVPFIVAGAGGYADLHKMVQPGDPAFPDSSTLLDDVTLEKYCDHSHGFLRIAIEKTKERFALDAEYFTIGPLLSDNPAASVYDSFSIDLTKRIR
jgi:predicted phosphodiesterase